MWRQELFILQNRQTLVSEKMFQVSPPLFTCLYKYHSATFLRLSMIICPLYTLQGSHITVTQRRKAGEEMNVNTHRPIMEQTQSQKEEGTILIYIYQKYKSLHYHLSRGQMTTTAVQWLDVYSNI